MPTPDPTDLRSLLETLDAAEEAAGWDQPAHLVGVEGTTLAYATLPGHPYDALVGWTAPVEWSALAIITEGWGVVDEDMDPARGTGSKRPSRSFGRVRIRAVAIVGRDGTVASGLRKKGQAFEVMEGPVVGRVNDAMLRAIGCPTPAPEFPVVEYFAKRWLTSIVLSAKRGKHAAKVPAAMLDFHFDDALLTVDHAEGWDTLRRVVASGRIDDTSVPADVAGWMDAGLFARTVINDFAPLADLVKQAGRRTDAAGRRRIEACLRKWNLSWASAA